MQTLRFFPALLLLAACQGPPGAVGAPGAAGANGVGGYQVETISLTDANIPPGALPLPVPPCPGDKRVTGGGVEVSSQNQRVRVAASLPSEDGRTWRVVLQNDGPATQGTVTVTRICATAT